MRILIALSLVVAGAMAQNYGRDESYGSGSYFSQHDLQQAEDFLNKVTNEKDFVLDQVSMLKDQKLELLEKFNKINSIKVREFEAEQNRQFSDLANIRNKMKDLLHRVGDEESKLAGEEKVARRNEVQVNPLWTRIEELVFNNHIQDSILQKSITFLTDAKEKLYEKLNATYDRGVDRVDELKDNTKAFANLVNDRHCVQNVVYILIDPYTGEGEATAQPFAQQNSTEPIFGGSTPVVVCAIQGIETHLGSSQPVGAYGGYPDRRENIAVSVDCKASPMQVQVNAFDQSRGKNNKVVGVYVQVKACSFGAQAGVPEH